MNIKKEEGEKGRKTWPAAARCRIDAGYRPRGSVRDFSVLLAQGETSLAKGKKAGIEGVAALRKTKKRD